METQKERFEPVLVNYLPQILEARGITEGQFRGMVFDAGFSENVADRMLSGATNFTMQTIFKVCQQIGCNMADLINVEFVPEKESQEE